MWIQKHWTLHKGWPGDVDTETLYKGWPGDVDTETLYKGWPGDVDTETLYKGWPGDVDTETLHTVQWMARKPRRQKNGLPTEAGRGRIAYLIEYQTMKTNTILIRCSIPHCDKDFSPTVSSQCRLSYGVCTAPVCNCINICAQIKTPNHPHPYHWLDIQKYCTHW